MKGHLTPNTDLMCYHCGAVLDQPRTREGLECSALPGTWVQCPVCEGMSIMHKDGLLRIVPRNAK